MNIPSVISEVFNLKREKVRGSGFRPYKVYTVTWYYDVETPGIISDIQENTMGVNAVLSRLNVGIYRLTFASPILPASATKLFLMHTSVYYTIGGLYFSTVHMNSPTVLEFYNLTFAGVLTDDPIIVTTEIRIY